ncbi:hypothetical protein [Paracoccus aestuariivivens]|uniref:DUF2163 domain-containing protein n=1 Tax=Paracoccus aestuariivivens TaxID=1820333 RepID=A0A6L6J6G9_9RHOB|nr:hypothetical protein [Paracoccus aestuariivivens]MTH76309.1 hypothetical protein [Paracoccus aestuariivivens]
MTARDDLLAIPDEVLRNGSIAQAALVHMDFLDSPQRWWTGFGDLDVAGHRWKGLGDLIAVSPIASGYSTSARQVDFTVAATPEMLGLALNAKARVRNRDVTVYLQLFANATMAGFTAGGGELMYGDPIGSPMSLYTGTMQRMPYGGTGTTQRRITLETWGIWLKRNAAPRGRWTHADQQARYPGDIGFERLPLYANGYETDWRK